MVNRAGLDRHPEFLAETARRIVQKLGYTEAPGDQAHGFVNQGRSAVRFWHRQHPGTMLADLYWNDWGEPSFARVAQRNPPWGTPGRVDVVLDPTGRLVRFRAVPPLPAAAPGPEPDWPAWFPSEVTGFDLTALQRVEERGESVLLALVFVVWIGSAILAWRNVRLGRCDRRGTLRVALWVLTHLGYLAMIVMNVTRDLLTQFPLTTDLSAWYAPSGLTAVLVLLALAAFGFYTSQAGRPIFGAGPAEPTLG